MEVNVSERNKVNKIGTELSDFITKLRDQVRRDNNDRAQWRMKMRVATNQRLGVKKYSNHPWPGAPNVPIQEADKQIRKKKPNYVLAVVGQNKPVNVDFGPSVRNITPELQERRRKAELAINHVLMNDMELQKTITIASDQFLEKGHCIFKVIEDFKSEIVHKMTDLSDFDDDQLKEFKLLPRDDQKLIISSRTDLDLDDEDEKELINDILQQIMSGAEIIEYDQEIVKSMPKIVVRDAERIIVPPYATDIEDCERITDEFFLTERQLMDRALSGAYNLTKVKKAIESNQKTNQSTPVEEDTVDNQKNNNEGITSDLPNEQFRVHEIYCWRPTGAKGKFERWVFTILADIGDDNDATIQILRYPYEFTTWNFVKHDNELKDERYHSSRGIPEQIRALQEVIEKSINNMLIRDQVNNNPMFTVLTTSKIQPSTIQFIPGQRIQVNRHDEISELSSRTGKVDLSSTQIFQITKAFLEEYIGSTDQLFRNATNSGGGKTLGEIKLGVGMAQNLLSVDLLNWNQSLKKVYGMVWKIMKERLGDPIVVNGEVITREDFKFDAIVNPTGTVEQLDKQVMLQKAFNRVNLIIQQIQLGIVAEPEDLFNAMRDFLEVDGVKSPERYITRPEIIQQKKMQQAQAQMQIMDEQEQQLAAQQREAETKARSESEQVEPVQQG